MKLRRSPCSRQLLFLPLLFILFTGRDARAQDMITKRDGTTQAVKIIGTTGANVEVQVGAGTVGIPIAMVASIKMTPPAEFQGALAAWQAKDYAKAYALDQ